MRKRFFSELRNESGFSMIEVSIAGLLIGGIAVGLMQATGFLSQQGTLVRDSKSGDQMIRGLLDNIREQVTQYQASFDEVTPTSVGTAFTDAADPNAAANPAFVPAAATNLPMAWSNSVTTTRDKCIQCPGRYGFVINTFQGYPGLYIVTVRVFHKDLWNGQVRDFNFLAGAK